MSRSVRLLVLLLAAPAAAWGTTWHILPDGSGDAPSIQAGIVAAAHYDTVLVAPGVYHEVLSFQGKKITVGSYFLTTADEEWIEQTVVDAAGHYSSAVYFVNAEEPRSVLCGLTVTHGFGQIQGYVFGGGVYCVGASPTLRYIVLRENGSNLSDLAGGGIYIGNGSPLLDHVRIEANRAGYYGGGVAVSGPEAAPILRDCVISENWSPNTTALDIWFGARVRLERVLITGNIGGYSRSIYCLLCDGDSRVDLINVTMTDNNAGIYLADNATAVLVNSIVYGNDAPAIVCGQYWPPNDIVVSHTDLEGGEAGIDTHGAGTISWLDGNLDADPLFVGTGDFHLTPGSPCLDAGTPHFVWDGQTLVELSLADYCGTAPDMGALEFCQPLAAIADGFATSLAPPWPNPCNPRTRSVLSVAQSQPVRVAVYDLGGRLVKVLLSGYLAAGQRTVVWDGGDARGRPVAAGAYFLRLESPRCTQAHKVLVVR